MKLLRILVAALPIVSALIIPEQNPKYALLPRGGRGKYGTDHPSVPDGTPREVPGPHDDIDEGMDWEAIDKRLAAIEAARPGQLAEWDSMKGPWEVEPENLAAAPAVPEAGQPGLKTSVGKDPTTGHTIVSLGTDAPHAAKSLEEVIAKNPHLANAVYQPPAARNRRVTAVRTLKRKLKDFFARFKKQQVEPIPDGFFGAGVFAMPESDAAMLHGTFYSAASFSKSSNTPMQMKSVAGTGNTATTKAIKSYGGSKSANGKTLHRVTTLVEAPESQPLVSANWKGFTVADMNYYAPTHIGGTGLGKRELTSAPALTVHRPHHKRDVVTSIIDGQTSAGGANSLSNLKTDYTNYLDVYWKIGSNNISTPLVEFLEEILNGTNSEMVYEAAWSVYSEFTGAPEFHIGPFMGGMNCIDHLEQQAMNGTNSTAAIAAIDAKDNVTESDIALLEWYAVNEVLLDIYEYMYSNGSAAVNTTGLLSDMQTLRQILTTANSSIMAEGMTEIQQNNDAAFFEDYDYSSVSNVTFGNVTYANTTWAR